MQGDHLLVSLGNANAIAVYKVNTKDPRDPASSIGLLPTGYFPENVVAVNGQMVVTSTRGVDARGPALTFSKGRGTMPATGHGTHSTTASVTRFTLPSDKQIQKYTAQVFSQNGWDGRSVVPAKGDQGGNQPVDAIPKRIGDLSPIKHVLLLVKENRSYDQLYGDIKRGNGDPSLMQGDNTAYTQTSASEYTRSYDTEEDVLGHQRSGFLWTSIQAAGKNVKKVMAGGAPAQLFDPSIRLHASSVIPSLNAITDPNAAPFDRAVPDIYRYETWKQNFEKNGPANLNMVRLSSDHTGGTADPEAQVADNDLAVGKIVDEISHSSHWKDSAIFVAEDDTQDGADHVDGHRAPVQVISPYAIHGKTVSTF